MRPTWRPRPPALAPDREAAEEAALLDAARRGEEEAREQLVRRYRPLVSSIAWRLHGRGGSEEIEDLIQVGMVGLLEAVSRYQPERGPFVPFARATVSGTIKRHFRDRSWKLSIPRALHDAATQIRAASREFEARTGRLPTDAELAEATELKPELIAEARAVLEAAHPLSLQGAPADGEGELAELIGTEDPNFDRAEARGTIGRLSAELEFEDRELLARRFGMEQTQAEIAERLGGSQMRISRRLRSVLGRLEGAAAER
jgi:RNA polymerase sigma-B factor